MAGGAAPGAGHRPIVVAVTADLEWYTHVKGALDGWTSLTMLPTVRDLVTAPMTPDIALWHLGSTRDADDACVAAVRRFRHRSPRTVVIAYCRMTASVAPLLVTAGWVGIDRVLLRGHDDLRDGIRRELLEHGIEAMGREVVTRLALPRGRAWDVLSYCIQRSGPTPMTVAHVAAAFGVDRKTLSNWLRAASLPPPEQIIGWGRLFIVARLLEDAAPSVASVARMVRFSSESDLRRMLSRYAGLLPRQMRATGGIALIRAAFLARVARAVRASADRPGDTRVPDAAPIPR